MEKVTMQGFYPVEGKPNKVMARWTGEKRFPKAGEFFLSGAKIMAYRAFADLTISYHIARLVEVELVQHYRIIREF